MAESGREFSSVAPMLLFPTISDGAAQEDASNLVPFLILIDLHSDEVGSLTWLPKGFYFRRCLFEVELGFT